MLQNSISAKIEKCISILVQSY